MFKDKRKNCGCFVKNFFLLELETFALKWLEDENRSKNE